MSDKQDRSFQSQFDAWIHDPANLALLECLVMKNIGDMAPLEVKAALTVAAPTSEQKQRSFILKEALKIELKAIARDVLNELIVSILEKEELQKRILAGGQNWFSYIKAAFINSTKEKTRKRPWMNLYRNANRVLRESSLFILYKPTRGNPLSFSLFTDTALPLRLEQDDLRRIPFPRFDSIDFDEINTTKQLIPLAEHFLEKAAVLSGRPFVKVYLNDFIAWIACHVEMFDPIKKKSGDAPLVKRKDGGSDDTQETLITLAPSRDDSIEEDMDKKQQQQLIPVWAENFANSLDDMGRKLFYYRHCARLTHHELADRMGAKSNLTYQLNKVHAQMKFFLRPLPWLSPEADEGPDEEAFQLFIKKICGKLKKSVPAP